MDVKRPRYLLSTNGDDEIICFEQVQRCCVAKRINGSPYDLSFRFGNTNDRDVRIVALFIQQHPLIYSLELYIHDSTPAFSFYLFPVITYHPGIRVLKFNPPYETLHAVANLFFFNTNLTEIDIYSTPRNNGPNKDLFEFALLSLIHDTTRNLCKLRLPDCESVNESNIFKEIHTVSALRELDCFQVVMVHQYEFIANLKRCNLEKLIFSAPYSTWVDLNSLSITLATHKTLNDLSLSGVGFHNFSFNAFARGIRDNTVQLQSLVMDQCSFSLDRLISALETNTTLTSLKLLNVGHTLPDGYGITAQSLASNKTLKILSFTQVSISDLFEGFLNTLSQNQSLEEIKIHMCNLSDLQLANVASKLAQNTSLQTLSLSELRLHDLAFRSVFTHLTQITKLAIGGNTDAISSETATVISQYLANNYPLQSLNIIDISFSEPVLQEISNGMTQNTILKYLNIQSSMYNCQILTNLLRSNLRELHLGYSDPEYSTPFLPTIIQLLSNHRYLKSLSSFHYYSLRESESHIVKLICEMFKTNHKLQKIDLFDIDLSNSEEIDFLGTLRDSNYSLTYFNSYHAQTKLEEEVLKRNKLIRKSRKFHKRVTLYELLLPFLRIE